MSIWAQMLITEYSNQFSYSKLQKKIGNKKFTEKITKTTIGCYRFVYHKDIFSWIVPESILPDYKHVGDLRYIAKGRKKSIRSKLDYRDPILFLEDLRKQLTLLSVNPIKTVKKLIAFPPKLLKNSPRPQPASQPAS